MGTGTTLAAVIHPGRVAPDVNPVLRKHEPTPTALFSRGHVIQHVGEASAVRTERHALSEEGVAAKIQYLMTRVHVIRSPIRSA